MKTNKSLQIEYYTYISVVIKKYESNHNNIIIVVCMLKNITALCVCKITTELRCGT